MFPIAAAAAAAVAALVVLALPVNAPPLPPPTPPATVPVVELLRSFGSESEPFILVDEDVAMHLAGWVGCSCLSTVRSDIAMRGIRSVGDGK